MGLFSRLKQGLTRTRDGLNESLKRVVGGRELTEEDTEALEAALLHADVGVDTTERLLEALRRAARKADPEDAAWARTALSAEMASILSGADRADAASPDESPATRVIMIVGVNGTGKTTTIGKLAHRFRTEGRSVLVVAADTFRAAATEQLTAWAARAEVDILTSQPGADPASVAFDGVKKGVARGVDVVLIDTAGRLHSKVGLMDELTKIHRVVGKAMPGAPHEAWLVLDGTTGQNALRQAAEFSKGFPLTGLVLTKIDGTAKGGVVVAIAAELELPVRYLGVGEGLDDLADFSAADFAGALLEAGD